MTATYRIQLTPEFGFPETEAQLSYFKHLGISHLYLSPITEARPGSTHGYDVVNHNAVREEIGGRQGFERLAASALEVGLEIIVDFVPNHSGVGPHNAAWQDVLAYGPYSPFASYFDIDWNPIKPELQGKILLPFLGKPYGRALDADEITLRYEDGYVYADYFEHRFRLNPATYVHIIETAAEQASPNEDLRRLGRSYHDLSSHQRDRAESLREKLVDLFESIDPVDILASFRGERLHKVLERQFWRLSFWKTAGFEINYRRFFDINGLVALRMEDDDVFRDMHQLLGDVLAMDAVAGVRVDHIDGLFDPHDYLERLRNLGARLIWVEKVLAPGETLPDDWPVVGTTGYEFMNDAMGVLVKQDGQIPLEKICRRAVGTYPSFRDEAYNSKKLVIRSILSSELFRLSYELDRLSEADYHTRDFTLEAVRQALSEIVAVFDRYRTYLPYDVETARDVIQLAVHGARTRNPVAEPTVFDFVANVILGDVRADLSPIREAWVGRFQQYTAPVAAKGVEDTAFYRYLPLTALNEVGGDPDTFGQSLHAFHSHARFRAQRYPLNLLATATHDHKRGEDTRMRLIALAEIPDLWEESVRSLVTIGAEHASEAGPSLSDRYLFFQTLAALWDVDRKEELLERLWTYMLKATRESKCRTSWGNPDIRYEEALETFVRGVLHDPRTDDVLSGLAPRIAELGFFNTLSQVVLKMTAPGIPDIYQGCELLDLSLVDPDNRRPVLYERRTRYLEELEPLLRAPAVDAIRSLIEGSAGRAKLFFTTALLRLRHHERELFAGDYVPLNSGEEDRWISYLRTADDRALIVVVPRFASSRDELPSASIKLPEMVHGRKWSDVLTGMSLDLDAALEAGELALPWGVLLAR